MLSQGATANKNEFYYLEKSTQTQQNFKNCFMGRIRYSGFKVRQGQEQKTETQETQNTHINKFFKNQQTEIMDYEILEIPKFKTLLKYNCV